MAFNLQDFLFGHSPETKQAQTMTPEQQALQQLTVSGLGSPTSSALQYLQQILGGDEELMKQFEAPLMRQFEQEIVPGIAERFAGMGTGGAQDSSAFQQTLGRAGKELSTDLASLRAGLKSQAVQALQGLMGQGNQRAFENIYDPGSYGLVGGAAQGAAQGLGQAAGAAMFL